MQIEAAVARKEFAPLSFEMLDLEEPRHDEVRVRLVASGVCHTDMAIRDQAIVPVPQPIVLGHEGAGVVEKVGASVTKVNVGDRVIVSGDSCGNCPSCRSVCRPIVTSSFNAISAVAARTARLRSLAMEKKSTPLWVKARSPPMWFATTAT